MSYSNANNGSRKEGVKSAYDWTEFSSEDEFSADEENSRFSGEDESVASNDSENSRFSDALSSDNESVDEARKAVAAKQTSKADDRVNKENKLPPRGKPPAKGKKAYGKSGKQVPRKAMANVKNTIGDIAGFKFGAYAGHRNQGRIRSRSPAGKAMVLSRRLSRRIVKGSPLRSPM